MLIQLEFRELFGYSRSGPSIPAAVAPPSQPQPKPSRNNKEDENLRHQTVMKRNSAHNGMLIKLLMLQEN